MDLTKISEYLLSQKLPAFRLKQIVKNYYSARYLSFSEMSDIPKDLRTTLDQKYSLLSVSEERILTSSNSKKAKLKLSDGNAIESVLMDYGDWVTACVSSQVGCPLGCSFCATGKMGFKRNLTPEEIVDQILYWNHLIFPKYVGRIVFMGMGEPFLNWDNLLAAIKIIHQDLGIGSRKISISTAGIVPKIIEFANLNTEINLAISLHSLDQQTRQSIMPVAKQYEIDTLIDSLNYYTTRTRRQLFLEYALIKNVNDTPYHLKLLTDLLKSNKLFYVNLIPLNLVKGGLIPSLNMKFFEEELLKNHLNYSVRQSIGAEISSACGQLIVSSD